MPHLPQNEQAQTPETPQHMHTVSWSPMLRNDVSETEKGVDSNDRAE